MVRRILYGRLIHLAAGLMLLALIGTASAQSTKQRSHLANTAAAANEPRYTDYKGVTVGMTASEVHKKLGQPTQEVDDQEFYTVSPNENVQIAYDASSTVTTISVDYFGTTSGAPDYKAVVGDNIETRADGSIWKLVRYEKAGFWVSYNRSAGESPTITVTIQKIKALR